MINRKIEMFLIITGLAVFIFFGVSGASMLIVHNDEETGQDLYETFIEEEIPAGEEIPTFTEFNETLRSGGIMIIIISAVSFIVGLGSVFMLKNDKYPKVAGALLLVIGVFIGLLQFGIALIGGLVYAIAGLMAVFRKPKVI